MEITKREKASFSVIGKEGSTEQGEGFVKKLWAEANENFGDVASLAKKDENGNLAGIWGAMTDFSRLYNPWSNNFSQGLYLAGVESEDAAEPPSGWVKWTIPAYEYIYVKNEGKQSFADGIAYLNENGMTLAGAVHEYTCPKDGQGYLCFPIKKL